MTQFDNSGPYWKLTNHLPVLYAIDFNGNMVEAGGVELRRGIENIEVIDSRLPLVLSVLPVLSVFAQFCTVRGLLWMKGENTEMGALLVGAAYEVAVHSLTTVDRVR